MERHEHERRRRTRHLVQLPVSFQCGHGVTPNLSTGGICFATRSRFPSSDPVEFALALADQDGSTFRIRCAGTVVRVAMVDEMSYVAATLEEIAFNA
jgi:hypothetical protein